MNVAVSLFSSFLFLLLMQNLLYSGWRQIHYVVRAGLELLILLPSAPKYCHYRYTSSSLLSSFPFLFYPGPQTWCCPHSEWVFLPKLNLSGNSLKVMP